MVASMAQGLHLSLDERDHVFRLAGHNPPGRGTSSEHINPGLLRILDRPDALVRFSCACCNALVRLERARVPRGPGTVLPEWVDRR